MKRIKNIALLLSSIVIVLLSSCEDMVTEIDVPSVDAKYVIESYLSPEDSMVVVKVGKTDPLFSVVDDDHVWMSQITVDINGQQLTREGNTNIFSISSSVLSLQPGFEYTVTLNYPDSISLSGKCTIPTVMNTSLVFEGVDSTASTWEQGYYDYYARYSFHDIAGTEDYYRIGMKVTWYDEWNMDTIVYEQFPYMEYFISDIERDGEEISGRFFFHYGESLQEVIHLSLYLYSTDKMYYDYHRAVLNENAENPFSEPVIIPTNVENGLGCVAGLRRYEVVVF